MSDKNTLHSELKTKGLSVVLGSYNRKSFLKLAIESIRQELRTCEFPTEIIVIDGGSSDGSLSWLIRQKDIITIVQYNRGTWNGKQIDRKSWGFFMNLGFRCAHGKYVCMLSDDCLVIPNAIINGYNLFKRELSNNRKIGAVAFFWRDWPDRSKYFIMTTPDGIVLVNHGIFLKEALEKVGYIDEENYLFYNADTDLCLRMVESGFEIITSPESYIEHYSHANLQLRKTNTDVAPQDFAAFCQRWAEKNPYSIKKLNPWHHIEKDFLDQYSTVKKFQYQYLFQSWFYAGRYCYRRFFKK